MITVQNVCFTLCKLPLTFVGMLDVMYPNLECDKRFRWPFGAIICGPTMSGKSEFVFTMIRNKELMIDKPPQRIVYCYGEWQPKFDELLQESKVEFVSGLTDVLENRDFFISEVATLLIIDDLSQSVAKDTRCTKLFTQGIHHKNVSVLLILQNLYKQGPSMRDIHLNSQYYILYKNCRDVRQVEMLAGQMGLKHLAYKQVTAKPYCPLIIDMKPDTPDYLRVRSHVLPTDEYMHIYTDPDRSALPKSCRSEFKG